MTAAERDGTVDALPLLERPVGRLVGDRTAKELEKLEVHTVGDLLLHLPRRYEKAGELTDMRSLVPGEDVTVMAKIAGVSLRRTQRGASLLHVTITDGVREMLLAFFARTPRMLEHHQRRLAVGRVGVFSGRVRVYRGSSELTHPDYQVVGVDVDDEAAALHESSRPVPFYPASSKLPTWRIRKAVRTVMSAVRPEDVPDPVPEELRATRSPTTSSSTTGGGPACATRRRSCSRRPSRGGGTRSPSRRPSRGRGPPTPPRGCWRPSTCACRSR